MSKKLPKTIYGHWNEEGTQDEYLRTDPEPASLVETGETLTVGVYELVGTAEVKNTTSTTVKPLRRKAK